MARTASELQRFNPVDGQSATGVCTRLVVNQNSSDTAANQHQSDYLQRLFVTYLEFLHWSGHNEMKCLHPPVMPRPGLKLLLGVLLAGLLLLCVQSPASALPGWMSRSHEATDELRVIPPRAGLLQEVAPPGAVQEIKRRLSNRRPQLRLLSPKADSITNSSTIELTLAIEDWPVSRDPELGIGPHVAIQVDDRPLIRLDQLDDNLVKIQLNDLNPGSHRFSAWAAYPWGEAVKSSGASLQWQLHQWQRLEGSQPQADEPWLVPNPITDHINHQPLLIDWLLWNAPLQNLRDGDAQWRVRVSLDGDSFLADRQDALWLKGSGSNGGATLQMELLDGRGEPLQPVFNNQLTRLEPARGNRPAWLKEQITQENALRLSGEPALVPVEAEALEEPELKLEDVSQPTPPVASGQDPIPLQTQTPETTDGIDPSHEPFDQQPANQSPAISAEQPPVKEELTEQGQVEQPFSEEPAAEEGTPPITPLDPPAAPELKAEEPVLRPQSSLGGSARELLNADGRLRQP